MAKNAFSLLDWLFGVPPQPAPTPAPPATPLPPLTIGEVIKAEVECINGILTSIPPAQSAFDQAVQPLRLAELRKIVSAVREPLAVPRNFSDCQRAISATHRQLHAAVSDLTRARQHEIEGLPAPACDARCASFWILWFTWQLHEFAMAREGFRADYFAYLRTTNRDFVNSEIAAVRAHLRCPGPLAVRLSFFSSVEFAPPDPCQPENDFLAAEIFEMEQLLPALPGHDPLVAACLDAEQLRARVADLEQQLAKAHVEYTILDDEAARLMQLLDESKKQAATAADRIRKRISEEMELRKAAEDLKASNPPEYHASIDRELRKMLDRLREGDEG